MRSITLFLIILVTWSTLEPTLANQHGDPCTDHGGCDATLFLECDTDKEKCRCMDDPLTSYYDPVDSKCHKKVDADCTPGEMTCPRNGGCSTSLTPPRCACTKISGYAPTPSKKCAKAYNAGCANDGQCDGDAFMDCEPEKKCLCRHSEEETSFYDTKLKTCYILANRECIDPESSPDPIYQPEMPCRPWTDCLQDQTDPSKWSCKCQPGLVDNGDSCIVAFGDSCEGDKPCDDNNWHTCLANNATCGCKYPLDHLGGGKCRVPLGRSCSGNPQLPCDEENFLICQSNKCVCQAGLIANPEGKCRAILGETCDVTMPCDESSFLRCENGNCKCDPDHPLHEPEKDACTSNFGEKCDPTLDRCDDKNYMVCESNKLCGCGSLGHPDPDKKTCLLSHGSRCQDDGTGQKCDEVGQFLECKFSKCACAEGSIYNEVNGCVLQPGATCQVDGQPCDLSHFYGCFDDICACSADSHLDIGSGMCVLNEGTDCVPDGQPCDLSRFLVCDPDSLKCGCDTSIGAHMDPISQQCVLPHNAPCMDPNDVGGPGQMCDPAHFLVCQDQICDCGLDAEWSTVVGSCVLNFDASCGRSEQVCNGDKFLTCDDQQSFKCKCHPDATWDGDEVNCFLNYHSACDPDNVDAQKCDENNYFACNPTSKICDCDGTVVSDTVSGQLTCVLNYEAICTPGDGQKPCDATKFLECDPTLSECRCAEGSSMPPTGICSLNIGQHCEIGDDEQPCDPVNYSTCLVEDNTCGCDPVTSVLNEDLNTCVLKYGAPCMVGDDKQKCDERQVLTCQVNGPNVRCGCDAGLGLVYDSVNKTCALGPNAPCNPGNSGECAVNSACIIDKCQCVDGFTPNSANVCVRPYGAACSADECDAEANQKCDTTCICLDRLSMEYVPSEKRCYTKLHMTCNSTLPTNSCMPPNLICDRTTETCVCDPQLGFVGDDGEKTCKKDYGSLCDKDDGLNGTCNFSAHTECSSTNTCGCAEGYDWVIGNLQRCAGTFDAPCDTDEHCHTAASLTCHDGRCICDPDAQVYESNFCYGLSGAPCNISKVTDPQPVLLCQKDLMCQVVDGQRLGRCSGASILTNNFFFFLTIVMTIVGINYLS